MADEMMLSQYPDAVSMAAPLKLVALQGGPLSNVNVPKAVLEAYILSLIPPSPPPYIPPATHTWATRPLSGNSDGDKIFISDVGTFPQYWVWGNSRWNPERGSVVWRVEGPIVSPNSLALVSVFSVAIPDGLLMTGSRVSSETTICSDQGGAIAPSGTPASSFDFAVSLQDDVGSTKSEINLRTVSGGPTYLNTSGSVVFVSAAKTLGDPSSVGTDSTTATPASRVLNSANGGITVDCEIQKTVAVDLIQVLDCLITIYP